jgi:hypothetical protein
MPTKWFISRDGKQYGPITDAEFQKLVELGELRASDFLWHDEASDWISASTDIAQPSVLASPAHNDPVPVATPPTKNDTRDEQEKSAKGSVKRTTGLTGANIFWICVVLGLVALSLSEPWSLYRTSRVLNATLFGAIGGALGAALDYLIRRRFGTTAAAVGAILGFAISHGVEQGVNFAGDRYQRRRHAGPLERPVLLPFYQFSSTSNCADAAQGSL